MEDSCAIHEIYNNNDTGLNFAELYRNAYSMVLHKSGEKLYSGLVSTLTLQLDEMLKSIEEAVQEGSFLEERNGKWNYHNNAMNKIRDMMMYMDRTYIPSTHKTPICELGLNLLRDKIVRSSKIQTRVVSTILDQVQRERTGEVMDRGLMKNFVKMFVDLGTSVYENDFEKPFLEVSSEFYKIESQNLIECYDCEEYLKKVEKRFSEEMERVTNYLDAKTEVKIINVVKKEMAANHRQRISSDGEF